MTKRQITMKHFLSSAALALGLLVSTMPARRRRSRTAQVGSDVRDQASLQRGARLFFNYCVGCHSLKYVRYLRALPNLGLSEQEVMQNLDFTGARFDDPVIPHMPA